MMATQLLTVPRTMTAYSSALIAFVFGVASLAGGLPAHAACNKAIAVTEATQMNFGTIGPTSAGGRVTVSPSGVVTGPAGYYLAGPSAAGSFKVTGTNNCAVVINFTPGSLVGPGGAGTMTVTNFTTNAGPTPILNGGGRLTFSVGADLVVSGGQPGGSYNGTYTVTVVY
jgi:Domain of unknown function (DUF4402)